MSGGIIQLVTYGVRELYLVGNPQITFFRAVYRRYTNFSMEAMPQRFQGDVIDFGKKMVCNVDKAGDLLYRGYLVLQIPAVQITRSFTPTPIPQDCLTPPITVAQAQTNFNNVNTFITTNMKSYRAGILNSLSPCIENVQVFCNNAVSIWETCDPNGQIRQTFQGLLPIIKTCCGMNFSDIYMVDVINGILLAQQTQSVDVTAILNKAIANNVRIHKYFLDILNEVTEQQAEMNSPYSKFAWIKRLGHGIIDYIDIELGGRQIDRHYGEWINIWHELARNHLHDHNYNKMIGNVKELVKFDTNQKPQYILMIPLQFWFCRNNGLALPLIAMQYHDLHVIVKLRKLEQCCYVDETGTLTGAGIVLEDAYLLFDYIYLDTDERRRFAQAAHEYLIEQVQRVEFLNFPKTQETFLLANFEHPCKELIFLFQRDDFVENPDDHTECRFDNYTLNKNKCGSPIGTANLQFNAYERCPIEGYHYFNYLQPWESHSNTPDNGINVFSFAIKPEEEQPSCTANLGRLENIQLIINFNKRVAAENIEGRFRVYCPNYNILRFLAGFSGLAFA